MGGRSAESETRSRGKGQYQAGGEGTGTGGRRQGWGPTQAGVSNMSSRNKQNQQAGSGYRRTRDQVTGRRS